ncbi:TPA: hypothetical protein DCY65_04470 [Candidatus Acetothermia bacterium]|nr:hypothetical protein [Candidatus Acetothermia bacterium]
MTPRDEALGHLLAQACKRLRDRMHARMEEIHLHRGQGFILFRLGEQDGIAQTELAHQVMVRPATLTPALQRRERAGLIERRPDPADQRVSRVYLTDKGRAVRLRAKAIWNELVQRASRRVQRRGTGPAARRPGAHPEPADPAFPRRGGGAGMRSLGRIFRFRPALQVAGHRRPGAPPGDGRGGPSHPAADAADH